MIHSWWLRVVAFLLCIAMFLYGFRIGAFQKLVSYCVYPVLLVQSIIVDPIKQRQDEVACVEQLQEQLAQLRKENDQLLAENIQLKATNVYMADIQELNEYKKRYLEDKGHVAQVLVRHFSDTEHYFYIDGGSNKQIEKDMAVVYKNNLVGKVAEVYPWYSKVTLITDRTCKVASFCSKTNVRGIHRGSNHESQTTLCYVNHLESVLEGDLVLSSGEGMIFPQGFALGTIKTCQTCDLHKQITVEPQCDLRRLDYCVVVSR